MRIWKMEPVVGFEPTTDGLQNRCSTTELNWLNAHETRINRPRNALLRNTLTARRNPIAAGFISECVGTKSGGIWTVSRTVAALPSDFQHGGTIAQVYRVRQARKQPALVLLAPILSRLSG